MNNKTEIEEDIKMLEEMIRKSNIEDADMNDILQTKQIEALKNILADRERLIKSQKDMIEKLVKDDRFDKANKYDSLVERIKEELEISETEYQCILNNIDRKTSKIKDEHKIRATYAEFGVKRGKVEVLKELLDTVEEEI